MLIPADSPDEITVKYKVFDGKLVPIIDRWLEEMFTNVSYKRDSSGFHIPTSTRDITFRKIK